MLSNRQLFLLNQAQTTDFPLMLEIERAEGVYLYDQKGKRYLDLISGISVSNLGHRHPAVVKAVKDQVDQYMHLMVYGEYVQSPQAQLAGLLSKHLPDELNNVYFVNSGSEATEGAMKLAKRFTGRKEIIAFKDAYHGNTQGAMSLMSSEYFKAPFRPLLPDVRFLDFGPIEALDHISKDTAAVFLETIRGESGYLVPDKDFMQRLRNRCTETGTLLVLDEIQSGYGRTGSLFAFEDYDIHPDIVLLGKGMGGGMPLAAFVANQKVMGSLKDNPILGHITTFGGHPVCCAAGVATLQTLLDTDLIQQVASKENLFRALLIHPAIKAINGKGLMLALVFDSFETNKAIIDNCIEQGLITDWFLYADHCLRISPPLTISHQEIEWACKIILSAIDRVIKN